MKKYIVIVLASVHMLTGAFSSVAQSRYGVIGGMTFSTSRISDLTRAPMTQWHGGFTYKLDLPLGFSLQPSLVYHAKGTRLKEQMFDIRMSYLELPVSFQWGPDLLIFRPFLDITPYIGYALGNQLAASGMDTARNSWNGLNRFEYGLGLGIGLELWRFQVIGRYNWNFGPLSNADAAMSDGFVPFISNAFSSNNFGGFTLSLAILFGGGK